MSNPHLLLFFCIDCNYNLYNLYYLFFNIFIFTNKKSFICANTSLLLYFFILSYGLKSDGTPYASIPNFLAMYIALGKWYLFVEIIALLILKISHISE